jgi:hypothetical protein
MQTCCAGPALPVPVQRTELIDGSPAKEVSPLELSIVDVQSELRLTRTGAAATIYSLGEAEAGNAGKRPAEE